MESAEESLRAMASLSEGESGMPLEKLQEGDVASTRPQWSELLSRARDARNAYQESQQLSLAQFHDGFLVHFSVICQQLSNYVNCVRNLAREQPNYDDKPVAVPTKCPKSLVLETRAALRFAMACLSFGDPQLENNALRHAAQKEAVVVSRIHLVLAKILSQAQSDSKCRTLSAQLLSNLVTSNSETASVLANDIAMSPSKEDVTSRILSSMSESNNLSEMDPNWVDIMLASVKAHNREALAADVAVLHNCLASLQKAQPCRDDQSVVIDIGLSADVFASNMAANNMLMSTLVRQVISVDSMRASLADGDTNKDEATDTYGDSATEWILLLIEKLCEFGLFTEMYKSVGGEQEHGTSYISPVTPEHIVLLHCVERAFENVLHSSTTVSYSHPLGGKGKEDAIVSSNMFLARQSSLLRNSLLEGEQSNESQTEFDCRESAYYTTLEILASSLGVEDVAVVAQSRACLGSETELLPEISHELGRVVDNLSVKNRGRKARELDLLEQEQRLITVLVRLLGNLCFQCRQNQDLMRSTIVPFSKEYLSEFGDLDASQASVHPERTALHVLLSCTSFSYGCFTLREWAIVAIRNVLDANENNQKLIEQLEAQQPANTPELQRMGVRVGIDRQGQVSVIPEE